MIQQSYEAMAANQRAFVADACRSQAGNSSAADSAIPMLPALPAPPIGAQEAPPVDGDGAEGEATAAKPKGLKGRALWEAHLAKGRPLTRDDVPRLGIHALSVYLRAMGETVSRTMLADVELLRKTALEALAARGVTEWCKGQGGQ